LALSHMQSGKTPGLDGLTAEFYKQFWHLLGGPLVQQHNKNNNFLILPYWLQMYIYKSKTLNV
jgi:hypothetical protein